jgi:DNA-binding beta-propeller fold protein YncE
MEAPAPVSSLSFFGDSIYASTMDMVLVIDNEGKLLKEWGPFESNSIITSVSANKSQIAFADAGNKTIFILDKGGEVKRMIGGNDGQFIVPSPYFDVALDSAGFIYVANTGHRRVETRGIDGATISYFGEPGTAPDAFCGCCNPAHFLKTKTGYITAEKGINRIKILGESGEFIEFVSSENDFSPSVPLDIASFDGNTIYAANPFDSKLYVFKRK